MENIIEEGKILKFKTGSHMYGLNTEKSDLDYSGIFFPPKEYILGLKKIEQTQLNVVSKDDRGRNTSEAIDETWYELKRFINLAMQGNPNIVEMLFASEESVEYCSEFGRLLLDNRKLFLSQNMIPKFLGYAQSQKRKLNVKTENMASLIEAKEYLNNLLNSDKKFEKISLPELIGTKGFDNLFAELSDKVHFKIGAYTINRNITIKSAIKWLDDILNKTSHRLENIKVMGWEFKYGSHSLRLLYETIELCETGDLKYPLKDKDILLDIKQGKVTYSEFNKLIEEAELKLESLRENNKLPSKPNFDKIQEIVIGGYEEWLSLNQK